MEDLSFDLGAQPVRALNRFLHGPADTLAGRHVRVRNPETGVSLLARVAPDGTLAVEGD